MLDYTLLPALTITHEMTTVCSVATDTPAFSCDASPETILHASRLDFAYADRLVLKHIDLDVGKGDVVGLIGPNGGGKTTLIRLLLGLIIPTRGELLVAGRSPARACADRLIGYLPQRPELNTAMPLSGQQFLHLSSGTPKAREFIAPLTQAIGISDLMDMPLGRLSSGQLQRLLIARALVNSPAVLIMDEPTTGIDVASRHQFIQLLQQLREQLGLTIIMSTHDLQVAHALCDVIACLNVTLHVHHRKRGEAIPLDETTCSLLPGV